MKRFVIYKGSVHPNGGHGDYYRSYATQYEVLRRVNSLMRRTRGTDSWIDVVDISEPQFVGRWYLDDEGQWITKLKPRSASLRRH